MVLAYCCVSRGTTVLAEHAPGGTRPFELTVANFLDNCDFAGEQEFAVEVQGSLYSCLITEGFCFLAIAQEPVQKPKSDELLRLVREEFLATFAVRGKTAAKRSLNRNFGPVLKTTMEDVEQSQDKVARIQDQVAEVRGVMAKNIQKVLRQNEHVDKVQQKAEYMGRETEAFQKGATTLRNRMWWTKCTAQLTVCGICAALVLVVLAVVYLANGGGKNGATSTTPLNPGGAAAGGGGGSRKLLFDLVSQGLAGDSLLG